MSKRTTRQRMLETFEDTKGVIRGHSMEPEKCTLYEQFPFLYRLNKYLFSLFINGENEVVLY
jgi:hypothetical protein